MSTVTVIPCGCCGRLTDADFARFDADLRAHVCEPCRKDLRAAQAQLARPCDEHGRPIAIKGAYHGADAPDNRAPIPPASDL